MNTYINNYILSINIVIKLNLDIVNWDDRYYLEKKIEYIFYRIKFPYDIIDSDIPNILYTLSDHPPMSMNLNFK